MTRAAALAPEAPRVQAMLDALAVIGADPPGITRHAFGDREDAAHALAVDEARRLGLDITRDAAANLYLTWPGADRAAPRTLLGSHFDTVRHGGNFDGAAGVVAALAAVSALKAEGFAPRADITIAAFRCEEAVWFGLGLIGSRAALGILPPEALDRRRADTGLTLAQHIARCGGDPAALKPGTRHLPPGPIRCFLEAHIEQAPSLLEAGVPIGICTGIPGNVRHAAIRITGQDAHVGLPRRFRRDAALAGAEIFTALDALWAEEDAACRAMAVTIGRFHTDAAKHEITVVAGDFTFSIDLRAYDVDHLAALERRFHDILDSTAHRRGVAIDRGPRNAAPLGPCDPALQAALAAAAARAGVATMPLGSPASHDAANFAAQGIPTGLLLIRNANGSHNPHEAMDTADLMTAAATFAEFLRETA
ncbi:hydantoinase/carbamoylase family amidase [Roseomonas sp. CECT 9278]|uniref:hydantoinase/carbamoylase family amidase n=1 Tax=Roseomonas sp. CECT 9278 TaxID=2845823 RepID=UPI001E30A467|nr:hydantoinase/carbamoylase family amidase [Roseomonas sp. CECT 9278]CAH0272558.1 putative hydrolase [Roseomonas sp. CECT 9278]